MNLLHLVPKRTFDEKLSRVRFEEVAALERAGVTVRTTGPGWPAIPTGSGPGLQAWPESTRAQSWLDAYWAAWGNNIEHRAQMILAYDIEGIDKPPVPSAVVLHETHDHWKTMRAIRGAGATLVFFTYSNDLERYRPELEAEGRRAAHLPHGAEHRLYREYGPGEVGDSPPGKTVDVLIVGNLAQDFYPHRARLAALARGLRKRGYRVHELPHMGFNAPARNGSVVGGAYARWLSASKLVVTCTGRYRYAFAKLVEIPLCGALPVSDLPAERREFFRRTCLVAEPWMTDRTILYEMERHLDDEALLRARTTKARDLTARYLTLDHWAERFAYAVQRFLWDDNPPLPTPLEPERYEEDGGV